LVGDEGGVAERKTLERTREREKEKHR